MTYLAVTTTMRREEISMFFSPESEEDPFTLASSQNPFLPLKARRGKRAAAGEVTAPFG